MLYDYPQTLHTYIFPETHPNLKSLSDYSLSHYKSGTFFLVSIFTHIHAGDYLINTYNDAHQLSAESEDQTWQRSVRNDKGLGLTKNGINSSIQWHQVEAWKRRQD